jgi:predicted component of type VI protein secretion system
MLMQSLLLRCGAIRIHLTEGEHVIGRDPDCAVAFDDTRLSGRHAAITVFPGPVVTITDLGSRHGTWVNGAALGSSDCRALDVGDSILVGSHKLTVEAARQARAETTGVFQAAPSPPPASLGKGVLVVSPNRAFLDALRSALARTADLPFSTAPTLAEALPRRPPPLLLVLDEMAVGLDGGTTLDEWRRAQARGKVALFGDVEDEDGTRLISEYGCDYYIRRPASSILFVARIRLLLSRTLCADA